MTDFNYSSHDIETAARRASDWYNSVKKDLFERFARIAGRPLMADRESIGHTVNIGFGTFSLRTGIIRMEKLAGDDLVENLAEWRMENTAYKWGDNKEYVEMQRASRNLLHDRFIQELGGDELMQAVLNRCIKKGNFAERIKAGEFDGRSRG